MANEPPLELSYSGTLWIQKNTWIASFDPVGEYKNIPLFKLQLEPGNARQVWIEPRGTDQKISQLKPEDQGFFTRATRDLHDLTEFYSLEDIQGEYLAQIHPRGAGRFEKTKTKYTSGALAQASIQESRHILSLDANQETLEITGIERITAQDHGTPPYRSESQYRIWKPALESLERPADLQARLESHSSWSIARDDLKSQQNLSEKSATLLSLLRELQSADLKSTASRLSSFRALHRALQDWGENPLTPEALAQIKKHLDSWRTEPDRQALLIGAVAGSEHPEAQDLLLGLLSDQKTGPTTRETILNAWITATVEPSPNTLDFLRQQVSIPGALDTDLGRASLLALGASVRHASESGKSSNQESLLGALLRTATTPSSRMAALDAIGNSGSSRLLSQVTPYLQDPNLQVRARAYLALRAIPGREAQNLLENGLRDPEPQVRDMTARALKARNSLVDPNAA
jgi:hypothetical protein